MEGFLERGNIKFSISKDIKAVVAILQENKNNDYPQKIFELGPIIYLDGEKPVQRDHLSIAIAHSRSNYSELRSVVDALFKEIGAKIKYVNSSEPVFIEGRGADIIFGRKKVGFIGEVHPQVLNNFELKMPVTLCEIDIEDLVK